MRKKYIISGQVQGVGFRPFIYNLAQRFRLQGFILNSSEGVEIEVQGAKIADFELSLTSELPPLAKIEQILSAEIADTLDMQEEQNFVILASNKQTLVSKSNVMIGSDMSLCEDCLAEINDSENRRYNYAFTNCTNCGPRYTITHSIPYDRKTTSMACFPMCSDCQKEYEDPTNRRFHAQPNACSKCGPKLCLVKTGEKVDFYAQNKLSDEHILDTVAQKLCALEQNLIAIKGLGGFHLACNALDPKAITKLRQRKKRPGKALAIMLADLDSARHYAEISDFEAKLLCAQERPIVVCKRKKGLLPDLLSPDSQTIGIMLPYTPLHHILLKKCQAIEPNIALVMSSANAGGEPICLSNREAMEKLADIADYFLLHNRDILIRVDDSVISCLESETLFLRRARAYTPKTLKLPKSKNDLCVLALGAELKNTIALNRNNYAFVSQHIGDLENLANNNFFQESIEHLQKILEVEPDIVVSDLHPAYFSTQYAQELSINLNIPHLQVQHHLAHILAVIAEKNIQEKILGLALDGTGYGEDQTIWGSELFLLDPNQVQNYRRFASLTSFPLVGSNQAIYEPWRIAQALTLLDSNIPTSPHFQDINTSFISEMIAKKINSPLCSSLGRLFDAVSAYLGFCTQTNYEGQAAIILEAKQDLNPKIQAYFGDFIRYEEIIKLDSLKLFSACALDYLSGTKAEIVARRFHLTLSQNYAKICSQVAQEQDIHKIILTGGVLQNKSLALLLSQDLHKLRLQAIIPSQFSPNDGQIALGQLYYAKLLD